MARFNLEDYETVEERIKRFYALHEDGRIVTDWANNDRYILEGEAKSPRTWVVSASIYLTAGDQANHLPKATGFAFEIDGTGGANQTSALENAETSAIGRALANMNLSGNKRASRTEMEKVARVAQRDYLVEADKLTDVTALRLMWAEAKSAGVHPEVLARIKERADEVSSSSSVGTGAQGSVPVLSRSDASGSATGQNPSGGTAKGGK